MRQPVNQAQTNGGSVTFYSQGVGLTNVLYQWQCNGTNMVGATNASLTLTNAGSTSANTYRVVISNGAGSTTSSNATFTLITPPVITAQSQPQRQWAAYQSNLTLTVTASAPAEWASPLNYKWQLAGTDIWGATSSNYTILGSDWPSNRNYSVGITNVAGTTNYTWQVRVMLPGTVVPWGGADSDGVLDRPVGITNIVALAGGYSHAVALLEGGTVSVWGTNDYVRTNVPGNVSNVTAIACGRDHAVALKADGTVVAWGQNVDGCTN
ncbi:MAG: hypothetical protein NT154_06355, partial [Verrucomicrobia bacterium]|nr:hypothetical protein [Verrucomicrobiota bacterium]